MPIQGEVVSPMYQVEVVPHDIESDPRISEVMSRQILEVQPVLAVVELHPVVIGHQHHRTGGQQLGARDAVPNCTGQSDTG